MPVLHNIGLLVTGRGGAGSARLETYRDGALAWSGERLEWIGPGSELPGPFAGADRIDADGAMVVPGLIDCHTHLAFGGWREGEFVRRNRGESYLEIARAGGGIRATVEATRKAGEEALLDRCLRFLDGMAELGVTTVECKSGYGLDLETELKILRVYRDAAERHPVRLVPTLLAAHALPREYRERREEYIEFVCRRLIPAVADEGLARFCDVFVEAGAFSVEEARRILTCAAERGMESRVHAEQFTDSGGAVLAGTLSAASADHLEQITEAGIRALNEGGVTAVILPLASLYLHQPPASARGLLDGGVPVAVATDFNPGSAPSYHLPLALTLACLHSGMTPAEALAGATRAAAGALRLGSEVGTLEAGKSADFAVLDAASVEQWIYHFRPNACRRTFIRGREFERREDLERSRI